MTTLAKTISPQRQAELTQTALETGMKLRDTLGKLNLQPDLIQRAYVVSQYGFVVAFYPLEMHRMEKDVSVYQSKLHHLSSRIRKPMSMSNSQGFRFAVLLEKPKRLPKKVELRRVSTGRLQLGVSSSRQVISIPWAETGHILVAGLTGFGKTSTLRLIVYQALRDGFDLLVGDIHQTAFPMLEHHPQVTLVYTLDEYQELVMSVHRIIGERTLMYRECPTYPERLDEYNVWVVKTGKESLPRILVVFDEYNSVAENLGSDFRKQVAGIANQGRKFGITLILAAQDFSKKVLGNVRDQLGLKLVHRVENEDIARNVGVKHAANITKKGLALTNRLGPLQVYYLPKEKLIELGRQGGSSPLPISEQEQKLFERALHETDGKMTYTQIMQWVGEWNFGWSQGYVRKKLKSWELSGWIAKDANRKNARFITPKIAGKFNKLTNAINSTFAHKHPQNAHKHPTNTPQMPTNRF